MRIDRRQALGTLGGIGVSSCVREHLHKPVTGRWRGFNLQEKFTDKPDEWLRLAPEWGRSNEPFRESDFEWMALWGFNYVRLPMSYRCWTDPQRPLILNETVLKEIDRAVDWGRQYGQHVCINFHRAPGYCINGALSPEPWNLWTDDQALEILTHHWKMFAIRYKGVSNEWLSFNPINEPSGCSQEVYARVIKHVVDGIRAMDPARAVSIDGMFGEAFLPVPALFGVPNSIQSTRGYAPFSLSHHLAPWAGTPTDIPAWPMPIGTQQVWDAAQLRRWCIEPFSSHKELESRVFVGEWGCWNKTPHNVALLWMRDFLSLWREVGWGWALWCFRGSFGILDSNRADVKYDYWKGHKLDRAMLELLREF